MIYSIQYSASTGYTLQINGITQGKACITPEEAENAIMEDIAQRRMLEDMGCFDMRLIGKSGRC